MNECALLSKCPRTLTILFYYLRCLCNDFNGLSALVGCWFSVIIRRIIYKFSNVCPFDYTAFGLFGRFGSSEPVNYTSLVAVYTPTDRPK